MSVSFQRQMDAIAAKAMARGEALVRACRRHVGQSIRFGSAVTGAPGQPVKSGALLADWREEMLGPHHSRWISYLIYARIIEYNLRGAQLRSKVGGFHSVTLTRLGWQSIVRYELARVKQLQFDPRGVGGQFRDPTTGRFA